MINTVTSPTEDKIQKVPFAPYLPQMADDDFITEGDLQEDNNIIIEIRWYNGAARGDEIRLFFPGHQPIFTLIDDPKGDFPVIIRIPAAPLSDGVYSVYYSATDVVGNISHSSASLAMLIRNGSGNLPPPVFTDAVGGVIDADNILTQAGTHVRIPVYAGSAAGDIVTLLFYIRDNNNILVPESQYEHPHPLTSTEVGTGFICLIPEHYLFTVSEGHAFVRYMVIHTNGQSDSSQLGQAQIIISEHTLLPAPAFLDSHNGLLTDDDITRGVRVALSYPGMAAGTPLTVSLRGLSPVGDPIEAAQESIDIILTPAEAAAGQAEVIFSRTVPELVGAGYLSSRYTLTTEGGLQRSDIGTVRLDLTGQASLPAPRFTAAVNGILSATVIEAAKGTPLEIAYEGITAGDQVTTLLSGYDADNQAVPAADYQDERLVTVSEQSAKKMTVTLPSAPLLSVGNGGTLRAYYTVQATGQTWLAYSLPTEVIMKESTTSSLDLILTLGAPPTDTSTINLTPYNRGVIHGRPGERIRVTCATDVTIMESGSTQYELSLDTAGYGNFRLFSRQVGSSPVNVVNLSTPGEQANEIAVFDDYRRGEGDFLVIASTTGAPANGSVPCSVYLVTNPATREDAPIDTVRVTVKGGTGAEIVGYPGQTTADITLKSDNSAEIDIVSTQPDSVTLDLTLPASGGSFETVTMGFVPLPALFLKNEVSQ